MAGGGTAMELSWGQIGFELGKICLQAIGAMGIAWLAVRWALSRYKSEKTWERRLAAYADVVSALSEMRLVVGRWIDELESGDHVSGKSKAELQERYQGGRRRFDDALAVARLLLPKETSSALSELDGLIEGIDDPDPWKALNLQYSMLDDALHTLTLQGRAALGMSE
jgi:hypothetical protein